MLERQQLANKQSIISRRFVADTLALLLFFTAAGVINERFIAGMTWDQVFHARLIGGILMVPVGRPYGVWRDWIMRHAKRTRLSQLAWDGISLVSFQVPIYAGIIALIGATGSGLLRGIGRSSDDDRVGTTLWRVPTVDKAALQLAARRRHASVPIDLSPAFVGYTVLGANPVVDALFRSMPCCHGSIR